MIHSNHDQIYLGSAHRAIKKDLSRKDAKSTTDEQLSPLPTHRMVCFSMLYVACLVAASVLNSVESFTLNSPPAFVLRHHHHYQTNPPTAALPMSSTTTEIEVIRQPDKEFLDKKGVFNWGTWGCGVSKFPWTYDSAESCYLLSGKVVVTPTDGRAPASFGTGDFVTFPAGMSCTWDVSEPVQKHFLFH